MLRLWFRGTESSKSPLQLLSELCGPWGNFCSMIHSFFLCKIITLTTSFNRNTIHYRPTTSFLRFRIEGLKLLMQNSHSHWSASEQVPMPSWKDVAQLTLHTCGLHGLPRSRGVDLRSEHRAETIFIVPLYVEDYSLCCGFKNPGQDWTVETFELAEITWDQY
jgi:hypothetical protein